MSTLRSILSYITCCFDRGPVKEDDVTRPLFLNRRPYSQLISYPTLRSFSHSTVSHQQQSVNTSVGITTDTPTTRDTEQDRNSSYGIDGNRVNRTQSTQQLNSLISENQDSCHLYQYGQQGHHPIKTIAQPTQSVDDTPKPDEPGHKNIDHDTDLHYGLQGTVVDRTQSPHHHIPSISEIQDTHQLYQRHGHTQPNHLEQPTEMGGTLKRSTEKKDIVKTEASKKKETDQDIDSNDQYNQIFHVTPLDQPSFSPSEIQDDCSLHPYRQRGHHQIHINHQPEETTDILKINTSKVEQIYQDIDLHCILNPTIINQPAETIDTLKTNTSEIKQTRHDIDSHYTLNPTVLNRIQSPHFSTPSISQDTDNQSNVIKQPIRSLDHVETSISTATVCNKDTDSNDGLDQPAITYTETSPYFIVSTRKLREIQDTSNQSHQHKQQNQTNRNIKLAERIDTKPPTHKLDNVVSSISIKKDDDKDTDSNHRVDRSVATRGESTQNQINHNTTQPAETINSKQPIHRLDHVETSISMTKKESKEVTKSIDGFDRSVIISTKSPNQSIVNTRKLVQIQDTNNQSHDHQHNQTNHITLSTERIDTLKTDSIKERDGDQGADSQCELNPTISEPKQSQHRPIRSILKNKDACNLDQPHQNKKKHVTFMISSDDEDTDLSYQEDTDLNCKEDLVDSIYEEDTDSSYEEDTDSSYEEDTDSNYEEDIDSNYEEDTDSSCKFVPTVDKRIQSVNLMTQDSNLSTPNRNKKYRPGLPNNTSSIRVSSEMQDILTKLNIKWNTNLQNNNFMLSMIQSLPQLYQDLLTKIIKNCRQTIENHLKPRWSSMIARYASMMEQQSINKCNDSSANNKELKDTNLLVMTLKSNLEVFIMQKIGFDKAIFSYFDQIINTRLVHHNAHDEEIDLNNNQTIQDIVNKTNLEINRVSIGLPIYASRYIIQQRVKKYQIVIVKGLIGCGKSTQIPQYIAELNIGKVICTQPTKMAAISLAHHLTQEYAQIDSSIDCIVNYNSLHQESCNNSVITFVTDSILLDLLVDDPTLSYYSCVIVDQAHQRSLYTDILLVFLKQVLTRRHDLKLIIISANVDTKLFSDYFNNCPVISVPGKPFPVDMKWCNEHINKYLDKALDTIVDIHNTGEKGDILVFLVTLDETEKACVDIKKRFPNNPDDIIALTLHDDLQATDLQHIFKIDSSGRRKIIFTTNCAETSMAIPGIRYVIDTGFIRERIYDNKLNCHVLRIHPICQNSAVQRCDRVGSVQSGVCYRLYSQQVYDNMSESSEPEIKRVHLFHVILKMIRLGVTDLMNFNFIESPSSQHISDSLNTLYKLSAITTRTSPLKITSNGKLFCKSPLEPRLSALIINANECNLLYAGLIIASALSLSCHLHCRYGSEEDKRDLDLINKQFCYSDGDVISTTVVYLKWRSQCNKRQDRNWCYKNKIDSKFMKHLDCKVRQLQQSLCYFDIINPTIWDVSPLQSQSRDKLRQLLFQCYHDRLALFTGLDKIGYITTYSDDQYLIHTSSTLFTLGLNPKFVVYQEILTTWDNFLQNVTPVDEKWLQSIDDCNKYAKIKNEINNLFITHTIDNLGSIILAEYDTSNIDKMIKNLLQDENIRCNIIKNTKGGHLEIATIKSKMPRLIEIINKSIKHKKEKLMKAIKILCKEDNNNNMPRLIIGRGIIVKDILLPSDCIEFKITLRYNGNGSPDEDTAMEAMNQVQAILMSCGELAVDIDSTNIHKSKDCKFIRFDKIVYQEIRSQLLLKEMDMKIISGYEINIENGSLANCNISRDRILVQFRWPRRPRNGKGSITCRDRFAAMNVQHDFPLTICNQIIGANLEKKHSHILHLCHIPNFITEADIRMAIPLVNRRTVTDIRFHRVANIDDISSSDLESALQRVLNKNGYKGMYSKVTIKPMSSAKQNSNIMADVIFRTYDDAVSAVHTLNDGVYKDLIDEPISVRLGHSRIIKCQPDIYACVASQLDRVRENVKSIRGDQEKLVHIDINPPTKKYPLTSIVIRSWNELSLNEIVRQISNIIEPVKVQIDVTEILDYLTTKDGKAILTSLSHHFKVYAIIDWKSQCILIYGVKDAKEQAFHYCQKEIKQLQTKCNIIDLVGNYKPRDLVKVIIKRYGIKLNKLRQSSGADIIRLHRKNKTLIVIGKEESFTKVLNEIDLCCNTLDVSKEKSSEGKSVNECVACFCQVDDDDDNYRLQYCGHLYCQQCITEQINDAIKSLSFPLNCANCNQEFVIGDLEQLVMKSPQLQLFDVLITEFVRRHPDMWHYCPTPECDSVYKRSESVVIFTCPICQKKTCRKCDTEDHPGYDCNEIKLIRKNPNASIEKYLTKNSESIKKCPKCSAAIEKSYGCHHMECGFCRTHFCWLCSAGFETSKDCYKHLQEKHGSYVQR